MEENVRKRLNEVLSDLDRIRSIKGVKQVEKITDDEPLKHSDGEGRQGESNKYSYIYHIEDINMFIKVKTRTDSYGDNESIYGVQLVEPKQKTVTIYE